MSRPAIAPIARSSLRVARTVIIFAVLTVIALGLGSAWMYSYAVLHPGCQGDRASLAEMGFGSQPVAFPSRHGPTLRGWFSRGTSHPDVVIIVIPGHAGNTNFALPDASIAARAGYSTLIYEHRSCADPSLAASTGYYEADDLLGAVDYVKTRPEVAHIAAWGYSEGGTAALLAASREPSIGAVIAMGGYASLKNDLLDPSRDLGLVDRVERQLIVWTMGIQLGVAVEASSPIEVIARISPRPILLIYGEHEQAEGDALYQAAGDPKEIWIVPSSGHGGYAAAAPEEYPRRVLAFFARVFNTTE